MNMTAILIMFMQFAKTLFSNKNPYNSNYYNGNNYNF